MKKFIVLLFVVGCSSDDPVVTPVEDTSNGQVDMKTETDVSGDGGADVGVDGSADASSDASPDVAVDLGPNCEPPIPGTNREGDKSDGWEWEKQGRLFPIDPFPSTPGDGAQAPEVIRLNGEFRVYFTRRIGGGIWTATSSDGLQWSDPVALSGFEADSYTSLLVEDGIVKMWFGSGRLEYAASTDGLTFGERVTVLRPSDVGEFGSLSLSYPEVQPTDDGYRMWFTGFDGRTFKIGTATSEDGINWTPRDAPVFEATGGTNFDSTTVGQSGALRRDGTWYVWYGGYDESMTQPGPWRVGLATSTDGETYERVGVSVPLSESGDDIHSTRAASVVETETGFLMVYVGLSDDGHYRLLSAKSDACP